MNLGEKVRNRREEMGMSQEELAKKMGYCSRSSVNKIENGRPCSQKIIARLAEALNVSIPYLMGWEEIQKKGSTVADATIRMKNDAVFLQCVELIIDMDKNELQNVIQMLNIMSRK